MKNIKEIYEKYPMLKNISNESLARLYIGSAKIEHRDFNKACSELLVISEEDRET